MSRRNLIVGVIDAAIVVAAVVALWPYARNHVAARTPAIAAPLVAPGASLTLPGVNFSDADRHVVLIVRSTCPACNEGLPFYRVLADRVRAKRDMRLLVLSPEPPETARAWLTAAGVRPHDVLEATTLPAMGISVVPTLLIVDRAGRVTDVMLSKLNEADQAGVLARLDGASAAVALDNTDYAEEITLASYQEAMRARGAQLVDVRDRQSFAGGHLEGARNIPFDELQARAKMELDAARPVMLDCGPADAARCRALGRSVGRMGFRVMLLLRR